MQNAMEDNEMKAVLGVEIQEFPMKQKEGGMDDFSEDDNDKKEYQSGMCNTLSFPPTSWFIKQSRIGS